ncbi:hypothetical protein FQN57_006031 [Myotisia sp. PD_48]|nr:hypothetical protein FQN57_006031 [Myotisia sp. PD_48]
MGLTSSYLFLYNLASLGLWSTLTFQLLSSLYNLTDENDTTTLSNLSTSLYPLLQTTQSLAVLEVFHSLLGLVRAGIMTTAMQVSSRLLLVWGVMFVFSPFSRSEDFPIWTVPGGKFNLLGAHGKEVRASDWAFAGCVLAWGVTECIRYSFFVLQLSGKGVPKFLLWLSGICDEPESNIAWGFIRHLIDIYSW